MHTRHLPRSDTFLLIEEFANHLGSFPAPLTPPLPSPSLVYQEEAPKVYEPGGSLVQIRERVEYFAAKYVTIQIPDNIRSYCEHSETIQPIFMRSGTRKQRSSPRYAKLPNLQYHLTTCYTFVRYNEDYPAKKMELVLFDDALKHLLRINRLIEMPRGSALLVGVGGSGKQSLTRLTAYICRAVLFQITLTKSYNMAALNEDLKFLYRTSGQQRKQTAFLFTESEIKDEVFLELINSILMTGEVRLVVIQ